MTPTPAGVYARQRADIVALVRDLGPDEQARTVPGCPAWQVRELVSHLAGLPADVANGRLEGAGSEAWTAVQVAERQGRSTHELLEEWARHAPALEAQLDAFGIMGYRISYDITMHGDDLREALGDPLGASPDHLFVLEGLVGRVRDKVTEAGLPGLTLAAGERTWTVGEGPTVATVRASDTGELARALGGRRTATCLRSMVEVGDAEPFLPHLTLFPPLPEPPQGR